MKKLLFIFLSGLLFTACSDSDEGNNSTDTEAGYAKGIVLDTQGNPIAGAYLYLQNTTFYNSYINGSTSEDGTYKYQISAGYWKVFSSFNKEYNGQTYSLQLYPDNTDTFSEEGAVRNFTWKLEGRDPDGSGYFYGGEIALSFHYDIPYEEEENIELTFTAIGSLIDGSQGNTITLKRGDHYWDYNDYYIEDIPIGRYRVTAVLNSENGNIPLRLRSWDTEDDFVSEFQLDFIPDTSTLRPKTKAFLTVGY